MKKVTIIEIPSLPTTDPQIPKSLHSATPKSRSGIFSGQISLKSARNALKQTKSKSDFNFQETVKNAISTQPQFPSSSGLTKIEGDSLSSSKTIDKKPGKNWKLLRSTKDIICKKSVIDKYLSKEYTLKREVPSTVEIIDALMHERKTKSAMLNKRKSVVLSRKKSVNEPFANIRKVAERELLAKAAQQNRLKSNQYELADLVDIIRLDPKKRSIKQLEVVLSWMLTHCPKNACVYEFLGKATMSEALAFCRGLMYSIYDRSEPIIRQNEIGDNYYVLLSGRASVFVNQHLSEPERHHLVANEDFAKTDIGGLGVKVDFIHAGRDFGEIALLDKVPRTASIISSKLCVSECLVCSNSHFQKCMEAFTKRSQDEFIRDLRKFYILKSVDDIHINQIFKRFQRVELFAGKILSVQGCHVDNVYLMISGECAEWYEMTNSEMRNGCKKRKKLETQDKNKDEHESDNVDRHKIAPQFKRTELSILECDDYNTVIGGYYALKKKVVPTTIVCKTDCVAIMCTAANFHKSANIPIYERMRQIGEARHAMTLKRISNYKHMAITLSKDISFKKNKSKERLKARSKSAIFIENNARLSKQSKVFESAHFSEARSRITSHSLQKTSTVAQGTKRKSGSLQLYSYIGPKDNLPHSQNKRYRSVSLMLPQDMSIQKSVKVHHDQSVKIRESAESQNTLIHHELPKIFEKAHMFSNSYNKTKERFRSASMTDLKRKYGVPTDVWQIDTKYEKTLEKSMSSLNRNMNDVIVSKDKKRNKHYNSFGFNKRTKSLKRKRSKSAATLLMDHAKVIVKGYEDLIDGKGNGTQNKSKRASSIKKGFGKRRRAKSLAIFGQDLKDDMNELEYRKLKKSYTVLNLAFKELKKDRMEMNNKKRGTVAVKGHQKLNTLSKNVVKSRCNESSQ